MKIFIFGAGAKGKLLLKFLGANNVQAFIDNNDSLWDKKYNNVPIISLNEYKEKYSEGFIVVTPIISKSIIKQLNQEGIDRVFTLKDCPDGFYDYKYDFMMEYILQSIKDEKKIRLYGFNFFSMCVYDYLKSVGYSEIQIEVNSNTQYNKMPLKYFKYEYNIKSYDENIDKDITLFLTCPIDEEEKNKIFQSQTVKILYDFQNISNITDNEKILQFKNKHLGQRCFIVATGPSLKIEDLETLKINNELSISVNAIYKGFDKTEWRPDYYVTVDPRFENMMEQIDEMNVKYKFVSDRLENFWKQKHADNVFKVHAAFNERELMFSEDLTRCFYSGGNVIYNSLQLAVYMGFEKIYLIGVDFSVGKQKHFVKDYIDDGKGVSQNFAWEKVFTDDEFLWSQKRTFKAAKKYADSHGIKIYNATRGGYLEIFERVNFDDLFK